jgi:hypothetical protein
VWVALAGDAIDTVLQRMHVEQHQPGGGAQTMSELRMA